MALSKEAKMGISNNLGTALNATLGCLQWCEKKTSPEAALTKQTAVLTIALISIGQILLETAEESRVILPH